MRAFDLEAVHQRHQLGGHLVDREGFLQTIAATSAALIVGNDLVVFGKHRHLRLPVAGHAVKTTDKNQRMSFSSDFIINFTTVIGQFRHALFSL
ncbi:MAG: hypothetical protein WCK07_22930 [Betaproteobacteria bacterium]